MNRSKKKHDGKEKITRLFGRIVTQPGKFEGRPFIQGRSVELQKVLALLHEDAPDGEISKRLRISGEDIDVCRAWQVCREPERLSARFPKLADPQNFFMLDENSSQRILFDVARIFGRSSHVRAEGLVGANNDDEACIWAHVLRHDYKAFLTADDDFHGISLRYRQDMISKYGSIGACPEPVPVVIFYDNQDTPEKIVSLLKSNQDAIRHFAEEKDAAYARLTPAGLVKHAAEAPVAAQASLKIALQR